MARHSTKISLFAFLILITFLVFSCKKENPQPLVSTEASIVSLMNNTQADIKAPGWMASIWTPEESYVMAMGLADKDALLPLESDALIRIGSITKTFVATLTLILCDEGVLDLEDKLQLYYPEFPQSDQISIQHLLMHTSGIVTWDENDDIRMSIYNGTGDWDIDKLIVWAEEQDLHSDPGQEFHYSNIGYFLLGKIIEDAAGSTVADAIKNRISIPLGLNNTFLADVPNPPGETIHGYDESSGTVLDITGTPAADAINFELAWTSGGMFSTLEDLRIWASALAKGDLLSDSLHQLQMPVLVPPSDHNPYWSGYGMGVSQTDVWIGHSGAISGYICNMNYNVEGNTTLITFFNKFSAFIVEYNTADMKAVAANNFHLQKLICPETLIPESK